MSIETQLRAALQDEAATVASGETDPYARVSAAVGRSRHRRVVGVGVVAAAAAIAIGVPSVMGRVGSDALPSGQHQLPGSSDKAWNSVRTWPLRGALAGNRDLVDAVAGQVRRTRCLRRGRRHPAGGVHRSPRPAHHRFGPTRRCGEGLVVESPDRSPEHPRGQPAQRGCRRLTRHRHDAGPHLGRGLGHARHRAGRHGDPLLGEAPPGRRYRENGARSPDAPSPRLVRGDQCSRSRRRQRRRRSTPARTAARARGRRSRPGRPPTSHGLLHWTPPRISTTTLFNGEVPREIATAGGHGLGHPSTDAPRHAQPASRRAGPADSGVPQR